MAGEGRADAAAARPAPAHRGRSTTRSAASRCRPARRAAWSCWHEAERRAALQRLGALVLCLRRRAAAPGAPPSSPCASGRPTTTPASRSSPTSALSARHQLLQNPPRLVIDIDGLTLDPALRELVGKVQPDDPFIAGVRVGQNAAARGAPGARPEAAGGAAAVHAGAGGRLPAPAGLRPVPDAGARPAAGADPRQGGRRQAGRAQRADALGEFIARVDKAAAAPRRHRPLPRPPPPRRRCRPRRRRPRPSRPAPRCSGASTG